jgi:GxxExxY protein
MITKKYVTQLSYDIVGCAINVHKSLGPGLLESVYQKCLNHELIKAGFGVKRQIIVPINYDGLELETELRLDFLVNDQVVIEIKAVEFMNPLYDAQILSYMKLMEKPQGLLINFHSLNIQAGTKPFVNKIFAALPE